MTRKLDKEHVDSIQELQQKFAELVSIVGNISIEKQFAKQRVEQLESQEADAIRRFDSLREQEQELLQKLKDRYGEGEINIVDGTFTTAQ
jgi:TolA-binding protein